jgi:hypothetical protein
VYDSVGITIVDNPAEAAWSEGDEWSVESDLTLGVVSGNPEQEFGMISGIAASPDGTLYVLDQQSREVRVFDASGNLSHRFGRPGQGPGEFGSAVTSIFRGSGDTIFVPDLPNRRVNAYLPDGSVLPERAIPEATGTPITWNMSGGRFVVRLFSLAWDGLVILRSGVADTLHTFVYPAPDLQMRGEPGSASFRMTTDPLPVQPAWTVLTDGRIAVSTTDRYGIEIYHADGRLDRIIRLDRGRRPITSDDREALVALWNERQRAQGIPAEVAPTIELAVPDSFPAFASLSPGPDGSLWIQHVAVEVAEMDPLGLGAFEYGRLGSRTWSVLDEAGRYLGDVTLPHRVRILTSGGDWLYGVTRGEMGEDRIDRLRLIRSDAGR